MSFHLDILDTDQKTVLKRLGPFLSEKNFYLGGGTALALHFGHRRSVDFDWFTGESLRDPMQLAGDIQAEGIPFEVYNIDQGTLHGVVHEVRVSMMSYRHPLLEPSLMLKKFNCSIAHLDDLGCMKLSAIAQRGLKKDFLDVYALLTHHKPLGEFLKLYQTKYGMNNVAPVLYGLVYFEDAEDEPLPRIFWGQNWETMKHKFRMWVRGVVDDSTA